MQSCRLYKRTHSIGPDPNLRSTGCYKCYFDIEDLPQTLGLWILRPLARCGSTEVKSTKIFWRAGPLRIKRVGGQGGWGQPPSKGLRGAGTARYCGVWGAALPSQEASPLTKGPFSQRARLPHARDPTTRCCKGSCVSGATAIRIYDLRDCTYQACLLQVPEQSSRGPSGLVRDLFSGETGAQAHFRGPCRLCPSFEDLAQMSASRSRRKVEPSATSRGPVRTDRSGTAAAMS
jgi:hypothetical protein